MTDESKRPKERLETLLGSLEKEDAPDGDSSLFGFMQKRGAARQKGGDQPSSGGIPEDRMKRLEGELMKEKERALKAELLLQERENARLEMEKMFKDLKDQFQRERMAQEMDQERVGARARVEVLEKRLEEMNRLLLEGLKEQKQMFDGSVLKEVYGSLRKEFELQEEDFRKRLEERYRSQAAEAEAQLLECHKRIGELLSKEEEAAQLRKEKAIWEERAHSLDRDFEAKERERADLAAQNAELSARNRALSRLRG